MVQSLSREPTTQGEVSLTSCGAVLNTPLAVNNWSFMVVKAGDSDKLKTECMNPAEMDDGHLYDSRNEAWTSLPGTFNKREDFLSSHVHTRAHTRMHTKITNTKNNEKVF